jgi:hypothetical protein
MNEIIEVEDDVAETLILQKIAKIAGNREFIVKPQFGISKAFKKSPLKK